MLVKQLVAERVIDKRAVMENDGQAEPKGPKNPLRCHP